MVHARTHAHTHTHHSSNILWLLGICIHEGLSYIITELLDKGSLDTYLQGKFVLDLRSKITILKQICKGMSYLHSHVPPILHHDLKVWLWCCSFSVLSSVFIVRLFLNRSVNLACTHQTIFFFTICHIHCNVPLSLIAPVHLLQQQPPNILLDDNMNVKIGYVTYNTPPYSPLSLYTPLLQFENSNYGFTYKYKF